jgi:amidase
MRALVLALSLILAAPLAAKAEDVAKTIAALQIERLRPLDFAPFADALGNVVSTPDQDALISCADFAALQVALGRGRLTAESLTHWHLARIKRLDDRLRGMLELNPAALKEARAADARRTEGKSLGPLDGIPIRLKGNIGTAGPMHTTANADVLVLLLGPEGRPFPL